MRTAAILLLLLSLPLAPLAVLGPGRAHAQTAEDGWAPPDEGSRPTSGAASFLSGRTLGTGEVVIGAALGWPGFLAHVELAPSSDVNIGVRGGVLYGSPVMGLTVGAGGELTLPIRVHVFGESDVDVALRIAPEIALGEGRLFGEQDYDVRAAGLGLSSRLDLGVRAGWRASEQVTLYGGADAGAGVSWVDGDGRPHAIGLFTGTIGIEALMARDTMLFGEVQAGAGVADAGDRAVAYYPQREIFRLALGLAYVL